MTISLSISTLAADVTLVDAEDVTTVDGELRTHLENVLNGAQDAEQVRFIEGSTPSTPASTKWKVYFKSSGLYILDDTGSETLVAPTTSVPSITCNARLTLTSGTAVTSSDVTAATHVYMTPYKGHKVALYNGSAWVDYTFSEIDIDIAGFTANTNYDVFAYASGGSVVAETVAWTDGTTRATALTTQNGVYVKSGTTSKRYIGTFRTTSSAGQCEDSVSKRYVWNYDNRVWRLLQVTETTDSWTYTSSTWRPWNNSTSNRVSFVCGVAEDLIHLHFLCNASTTNPGAGGSIGLDSTTTPALLMPRSTSTFIAVEAVAYEGLPSAGYHYLQLLESGVATATFYGDNGSSVIQSGAVGGIAA